MLPHWLILVAPMTGFSAPPPAIPGDHVCASAHNDNDLENYLCHAAVAKEASRLGQSPLAGVVVLAAWELTNQNFDRDDILLPGIGLGPAAVTFTAAGSFFFGISYDF